MPSSLPQASKRKARVASGGAAAPTASSSKAATAASASPKEAFAAQIQAIQASLSSSSDLNALADLIDIISTQAAKLPSGAVVPAISLLVRTLVNLTRIGSLVPYPVNEESGLLVMSKSKEDQVPNWIKSRFNDAVGLLSSLMLTHPKEKTRLSALHSLMELEKVATAATCETREAAEWSLCPWESLLQALVMGQAVQPGTAERSQLINPADLCPEVRATFVIDYLEKYIDVKLAFYRSLRSLLGTSTPPRAPALALLLPLENPPKTKKDLKAADCFVDVFAKAPTNVGGNKAAVKKPTKAKGKNGKRKIVEDGDVSSEADDDSEDEEEEEDLNWFSDSGDEGSDVETSAGSALNTQSKKTSSNTEGKQRRRRRGAASMTFHAALYDPKSWRASIDAVWLAMLLARSPKTDAASTKDAEASKREPQNWQTLTTTEINSVLRVMERKVLPYLSKPQLIADWLMDCLDVGGSTSLLSLSPLFTLFTSHSLSLPSLYSTLYTLLTPSLLHSPHRSHSLRLIALFLSSEKLPLAIILAFVKRLSRCALRGPPGGILPVTMMTYNLLKRHKEGMDIIHRDWTPTDDKKKQDGFKDPYLSSLDIAPSSTHATSSSLFEFASLGSTNSNSLVVSPPLSLARGPAGESHYHSATTTIVRTLARPFTKESYDLEEFLDHGYGSLIQTELDRTLVGREKGGQGGRKRNIKRIPAVRFRLLGDTNAAAAQGQSDGRDHRDGDGDGDGEPSTKKQRRVRVFPKSTSTAGDQGDFDWLAFVGTLQNSEEDGNDTAAGRSVEDKVVVANLDLDLDPDSDPFFRAHVSHLVSGLNGGVESAAVDGLDDEEREAREAMLEVEREAWKKAKREEMEMEAEREKQRVMQSSSHHHNRGQNGGQNAQMGSGGIRGKRNIMDMWAF